MANTKRYDESILEFEDFPGRSDIRVSKVLTTEEGDKIRAIVTTGNSVILAAIGEPNGDTVIVTGELPTDPVIYNRVWDFVKRVGKAIGGLFSGGGGQKCTTTTKVELDKNGSIKSITTTTVCSPA
jgi:hypothetical protein